MDDTHEMCPHLRRICFLYFYDRAYQHRFINLPCCHRSEVWKALTRKSIRNDMIF